MKRAYTEVQLREVVAAAGGREVLATLGHEDRAYEAMTRAQGRLIDKLLKTHEEVGELDPTTMYDYCCNLFVNQSPSKELQSEVELAEDAAGWPRIH